MDDIILPKIPGKHYQDLHAVLKNECNKFIKKPFIDNKKDVNISLFLSIINLVSLDDFKVKLLNRNYGVLSFEEGIEFNYVKFTNRSSEVTIQEINKPLPIIGRLKIKIDERLSLTVKSKPSGLLLDFSDAIHIHFKNPKFGRKIKNQLLKSIEITEDSFYYTFKNELENEPGIILEIDINKESTDNYLDKKSKEILGEKLASAICKNKCFQSCDDSGPSDSRPNRIETLIDSLHVDEGSHYSYLIFDVPYDNAEIALSFSDFSGSFRLDHFRTIPSDINGNSKWEIKKHLYETKYYTNFKKGRYTLDIVPIAPFPIRFWYNFKVYLVE